MLQNPIQALSAPAMPTPRRANVLLQGTKARTTILMTPWSARWGPGGFEFFRMYSVKIDGVVVVLGREAPKVPRLSESDDD